MNAIAHTNPSLAPYVIEARWLGRLGAAVLALGLLPVLAWLALAPLSSAVIAHAFVKVDLDRRPVQHAEGGIIREVKVRDGQRVAQGEPLIILGDVAVDADLSRLTYRLQAERASSARLEAEQVVLSSLTFSPDLLAAASTDARLAEQLAKERALFVTRRDALRTQTALLREQCERVVQEGVALRAQIAQASESLKHQQVELASNRNLLKDGFVSLARISQLEAGVADYAAKLEEKRSEVARAEQRLIDVDLRIKSLEGEYRQQAGDQLKVTTTRIAEIQEELRKVRDASVRQVIVAPAAGDVMDLKFNAPGAVVPPRETIANIVPKDPKLVIEAHIRTEDVSRVRQGGIAEVRFTAYKYRTTRMVEGKVLYVAADRSVDRVNGSPYYVVLVEAEPASLGKAEDIKLQAGMPAEVYIKGEERTPLEYLIEPVTQILHKAGREG
jgi:HlyD family type I secretion membrane fusion protein